MLFTKKPYTRLLILIIAVLIFILFSLNSSLRSILQFGLGYLVKPIYNLQQNISARFVDKDELAKENESLYQRLAKITVDYAQLKNLQQENSELRKELDFLKNNNYDYLAADVLAQANLPGLEILLINKGEAHGLKAGMPAIYRDGIMVGKIYRAEKFTSQLLLVNNSNSTLSAAVQNEQTTPGVITGRHNLTMVMEFIPLDQDISIGQTVVTSGREIYIPAGLVVGQITQIEKSDNEFFQSATITSPVKFTNIKQVVVLREADE